MITLSCSCGSAGSTRRHPLRGMSADERAALIRDAFSVSGGFLALEVDASWHPGSDEPAEGCVVLADLDSLDASAGLDAAGAKAIRDLLEVGHVRGQALPAPVEVGSVRFRVAPADEFGPAMAYMVTDGTETVLDATVPVPHPDLLPELVAVHRELGVDALAQLDVLAARTGLAASIARMRQGGAAAVA
ncbi:hypothetical protein [Cellulomonas sp.]|uniref:hypothetical protein n=1 Tax=Cellulomonas sp. TaxID=40001 RepID=UPI003BAC2BA1